MALLLPLSTSKSLDVRRPSLFQTTLFKTTAEAILNQLLDAQVNPQQGVYKLTHAKHIY